MKFYALAMSLLIGMATTTMAEAANINLVLDGRQWHEDANQWSDGNAASSGNDYFVGTPATGTRITNRNFTTSSTFAGDSLTINSDGELGLIGSDNGVHTVNLILNGGRIDHDTNQNGRDINLAGTINVLANSTIRNTAGGSINKSIGLNSTITGSADLLVELDDDNKVILRGVNNTFSGNWDVNRSASGENGSLLAVSDGSLGTGSVDIGLGITLDVDYDIAMLQSLVIEGLLVLDQDHTVSALNIGGTNYAPGTYTFAELNAAHDANIVNGGSGSITVIPEPASLALVGVGCVLMVRRHSRAA